MPPIMPHARCLRQRITTFSPPLVMSCTDQDTTAFDDFCGWLGNGQTLWTHETFASNDWYCRPYWNTNVCIKLEISYYCGGHGETPESEANPAGAVPVEYAGCMVSNVPGSLSLCRPTRLMLAVLTYSRCVGLLQGRLQGRYLRWRAAPWSESHESKPVLGHASE